MPLDVERCRGILPRGGTILGTSRTNPYKVDGGRSQGARHAAHRAHRRPGGHRRRGHPGRGQQAGGGGGLDRRGAEDDRQRSLGDRGDLRLSHRRADRHRGHRSAAHHRGVPRPGDRLRGDGPSRRMDRHLRGDRRWGGRGPRSGGALRHRRGMPQSQGPPRQGSIRLDRGRRRGGGAQPRGRWRSCPGRWTSSATSASGGISNLLAAEIEARTGFETRVTMLGHVQRGGTPTAFDRVLATRFGIAAIDAVHDRAFGQMVALQADHIVRVPLADALATLKTVDPRAAPRRGRGVLRVDGYSDADTGWLPYPEAGLRSGGISVPPPRSSSWHKRDRTAPAWWPRSADPVRPRPVRRPRCR